MSLRTVIVAAMALLCGAVPALARGGGGCFLPDTPITLANGSSKAIGDVRIGERVLAFDADGKLTAAPVLEIITHQVSEYLIVRTERAELRVTAEHPFYVGNGEFQAIGTLARGGRVFAMERGRLVPQEIVSIQTVRGATTVYNLQTGPPHTYLAGGVAVHNKGGGCFPAGTMVQTPAGPRSIETLSPGQLVRAIDSDGRACPAAVEQLHAMRADVVIVRTDHGELRTTFDHPLAVVTDSAAGAWEFRQVCELTAGQQLLLWRNGQLLATCIQAIDPTGRMETVYNLSVAGPHTFVADGFVVHNKGGGGGGGGHSFGGGGHGFGGGGSGGGSIDGCWIPVFIFVGVIVIIMIVQSVSKAQDRTQQNLDYCFGRSAIDAKAAKTLKLLEFIAQTDPIFAPADLITTTQNCFVKLQECWQSRNYDPMQPLLMPSLYADHCRQLAGLIQHHEINKIDDLQVRAVDLVNVRYMNKKDEHEFTALITAVARDYYVDDRTGKFIRGDEAPAEFQEVWTLQRQGSAWLLREIEQTRESDVLKEENFFEPGLDNDVKRLYGDAAGATGPAGPWLEKPTATKADRIERMLNFLAQTDKIWDRQGMIDRVRQVFVDVKTAMDAGDGAKVPADEMFPDLSADLAHTLQTWREQGMTIEHRNLCVRKVELILVRNFADRSADEFTCRVSAHAQRIVRQGPAVSQEDPWVVPFEEFWTFGRRDGVWKLKEALPPDRGTKLIRQENLDQDSTPDQLQWYYRQSRAN